MTPALDHDRIDDEMHELNQEADYLDQKLTIEPNGVNGARKHTRHSSGSDPDAQAQVITSLRAQVQDLFSQVTQLNNKLVHSYDRVSDLEDELHVTANNLRNATVKVSQLELERSEHLSALSTGLLVEKSHVTSELTRLMEKATEEAARAGEAESARVAIEKDLDDLSAGLFGQANTMVAEARLARARSERKVEETEFALKGAEEIVGLLQTQLQTLQSEKEEADRKVQEMRILMGKGKWVDRSTGLSSSISVRLLCLHSPYLEYLQFLSHMRTTRLTTQHPPAMSTLLPLPFLARLIAEDSDPTVRLDLAPSLNWLTRRSVLSAIHSGQLTVEPMSTNTLLEELAHSSVPGHAHVICALCGASVLDSPASPSGSSPLPVASGRSVSQSKNSWGPYFLKASLVQTISTMPVPFSHSGSRPATPTTPTEMPPQTYIFKLETTSSSGLPVPQGSQSKPATIYPLCASGWCLARLRTTCSLWAFVRTGIVERIWEDEPYAPPFNNNSPRLTNDSSESPPGTPRRSRIGIGSLWGTMSRSLSNTPKPEVPEKFTIEPNSPKPSESYKKDGLSTPRRLPPPPPRHPPLPQEVTTAVTDLPPPLPARAAGPPPPLPRRNRPVPPPPPPRSAQRASLEVAAGQSEAEVAEAKHADAHARPEQARSASHEESHEDFATPREELTSPVSRPTSPSTIPLPPSERASPVLEPANADSQTNEAGELVGSPPPIQLDDVKPAARSGTPTPAPVPGLTQELAATEPLTSTETATRAPAAPPPLPRRAANRGRPSSLPAQPPIVPPAEPEKSDGELGKSGSVQDQSVSPKLNASDAESAEPAVEQQVPEIVTPALGQDVSLTREPSPDARDEDDRHSKDLVTVYSSDLYDSGPADRSEEASVRSDTDAEDVNSEAELGNDEEEELSSPAEPGVYLGEATWEEKTWRELVRLRESMFWARIGGVR